MERLEIKFKTAKKTLSTLQEIMTEPFTIIVRDAAIQRFEYTFEAFWKYIKEYLKETEGIVSNSPKSCFKELFSVGKLTEEECLQCLEMTDRRNDTAHTYKEDVAQNIYDKINIFISLMNTTIEKISK